jgi:hypothetical protein
MGQSQSKRRSSAFSPETVVTAESEISLSGETIVAYRRKIRSSVSASSFARTLSRLPTAVLTVVESFTSPDSLRNLLNTSKSIFSLPKKEAVYHCLNRYYSMKYITDGDFRNRVNKVIFNPGRQLSLDLTHYAEGNVLTLPAVHKITFRKLHLVTVSHLALASCFSLLLEGFPLLERVSGLKRIETLKLINLPALCGIDYFQFLQEIEMVNCSFFQDCSTIAHVPVIHLNNCSTLNDISPLGKHQVHVTVAYCPKLTSVASLSRVKTVELYHCKMVADVSSLSTVRYLTIVDCEGTLDLRALYHNYSLVYKSTFRSTFPIRANPNVTLMVHSLKHLKYIHCALEQSQLNNLSQLSCARFHQCDFSPNIMQVVDLNALAKVYYVEIRGCTGVVDVNCLSSVHTLIIDSYNSYFNVDGLGNVHTLKLDCCRGLVSLLGLGLNNQFVKISHCDSLSDFSPLRNVPKVQIIACAKFQNAEQVNGVKILMLERLNALIDVSALANVTFLKLTYNRRIVNIIGLKYVHTVLISNCDSLEDISGLGSNETVEIENCESLIDITALCNVPSVTVRNCKSICRY